MEALKHKTNYSPDELDAFEALIARYGGYIHAIVSRVAAHASREDIEECAADVLAALWSARERIDPEYDKRYVAAVARNKAVNLVKRLSRAGDFLPLDEDILEIVANDPPTEYERKAMEALVDEALNTLPPPDPEIFVRRYYWGEALCEIARAFSLTERAVEGRLYRGRKQLKAYLEGRL